VRWKCLSSSAGSRHQDHGSTFDAVSRSAARRGQM